MRPLSRFLNFEMFSAYILQSEITKKYYVGSCETIAERLSRHNAKLVKSTKSDVPWTVVHIEHFETRSEAQSREMQIKSWKSRSAIEKLIKNISKF
mgnify:CR=1 FL=1